MDPCSEMMPRLMVDAYKSAGYDGIVITNHYFGMLYEWYPELAGASKDVFLDKYLFGFREAREQGRKVGLEVLPGAEVRFDGHASDYLLYGIDESFFYNAPLLNTLSLEELEKILPKGAIIIQAHPFRDGMEVTPPQKLFGVEVYNGRTPQDRNVMAEFWAKNENLKMTSGSDCHSRQDVGRGGLLFHTERKIDSAERLAEEICGGNYRLIVDGKLK